jgi:hypothetical protein
MMTRASALSAIAASSLAITGCAGTDSTADPSGASTPRQCFSANSVRNFRAADTRTLNVRAGRNVYRLDLFGTCPDLTWTQGMALTTTGSSSICTGSGLGTSVVIRGPTGRQTCAVQTVTLLTPEEIEALPAGQRP